MRPAGYALLGAMALVGLLGKAGALRSEPVVEIAGVSYRFPKEYRASASDKNDSLGIQFSREDLSPLAADIQGWDDNINLLITKRITTIPMLYDHAWDGTPEGLTSIGMLKLVRVYRVEPDLMIREMEKFHDIVIPDQDMKTMPIGMMRCAKPAKHMMNTSCSLMFDKGEQRWKITFGSQYLNDYMSIKNSVENKMKGFEVVK